MSMVTATGLIFRAAGGDEPLDGRLGVCRTCGETSRGILFSGWARPTFMDWDKLTAGEIICEACRFCFDDSNPVLDARLGKARQRMRNYSHFVVGGEWFPLSKGNKTKMSELLALSPEVVVIAESGQKHIAFRALPGWWQFEELRIVPDASLLRRMVSAIQPLYDGGFAKSEIESGRYNQRRVLAFGLPRWLSADGELRSMRGSPVFTLALFLAQKEEKEEEQYGSDLAIPANPRTDCGQLTMALLEGCE